MKLNVIVACGFGLALASAAGAANVYIISSTDPVTDNAAAAALTSRGHTVTIGVDSTLFDGTVSLAGYQTVYLQNNFNWITGNMPQAGMDQLIAWVNGGGRLVTSEWVTYYAYPGGRYGPLEPILPVIPSTSYSSFTSTQLTVVTVDPVINAGLPSSFVTPLESYTGTEAFPVEKPAARKYYSTINSPTAAALAGWSVGSGAVFSFLSTCGPAQVNDANFGRLFANVMGAGAGPAPCYANCDSSTQPPILNVLDFVCFQAAYAQGSSTANCDNSTQPPILNVLDFVCFQAKYAQGCP
jgi:hypothetical protein